MFAKKNQLPEEFRLSWWTVQIKLIVITSLIILLFITGIIFLTTYFFKNDSEVRIKENNLKMARIIKEVITISFICTVH
ncbi:MAG: hypothetical protein AAF518_16960, partial [Spirochaetota bacterium]